MRTAEDYLRKLQSMKPDVYMWGHKIEVPVDDPQIRTNYNSIALTYEMAHDPRYQEKLTVISPESGERINQFNHLYRSPDDVLRRVEANRILNRQCGSCIARCAGIDGLHAIGIVSYETDQKYGTDYHQRFLEFYKYFRDNDLTAAGAVSDSKGNRGLRPYQQTDPDLYLRVVERRKDGIVVKGCKQHITASVVSDELIVIPCRGLSERDVDYAVAFITPPDTAGIKIINVAKSPRVQKELELPISSRYAFSDGFIIFDNVFIPWERVFMCGEWEFAARLGALFGDFHRLSHCGCNPGRLDALIGAASMIAKYNGVREKSHVKSKLVDLITNAEIIYACGLAASLRAVKTPSGIYRPDITFCNAGKFHATQTITHDLGNMIEIAGGTVFTMPSEEDYYSPETGEYVKKYLAGVADVDVEARIRMFRLIEDLTVSRWATCFSVGEVIGAGPPEAQRIAILAGYDIQEREEVAKSLAWHQSKPSASQPIMA